MDGKIGSSIGQISITLCKDLGVAVDLTLWQHQNWAIEEITVRQSGSPLAT